MQGSTLLTDNYRNIIIAVMLKSFKYRIFPTQAQEELLNKQFGSVRFVYNWGLDSKVKEYETTKKTLSCFDLIKELTRKKNEFEWLREADSQVLQMALRNLDNAFTRFFRKQNGFPKFKNRYSKQTMTYPQRVKIDFENSKAYLPKIGWVIMPKDRTFEGKIKSVCISRTITNKHFASVLVDDGKEFPKKVTITKKGVIGVDVGLKHFATMSNGDKIDNSKFFINSQKRLAVKQRQLSRKMKGSMKRQEAKLSIAKIYEKIANQRSDFIHKLSQRLISENQAIAIEDLNINGMLKNHCLSKGINDVSWGMFFKFLGYKADWYGKTILKIGRFEPSSKICSSCGEINMKLTLIDRSWTCKCGITHDRDINASLNIKKFAMLGLQDSEPRINKFALSGQQ